MAMKPPAPKNPVGKASKKKPTMPKNAKSMGMKKMPMKGSKY